MHLIRTIDEAREHPAVRGGVVAIGNFDGVHRGHRRMIDVLNAEAQGRDASSVVLTFDPHPIALLAPDRLPPSLSTLERKAELLEDAGADVLFACRTTRDLLDLTAEAFFHEILVDGMGASGLVEGPNFHFGRDRGGDIVLLEKLCEREGMTLSVLEPVEIGGQMISSSRIRGAIDEGRLAEAVSMLGHPYELRGTVVRGDARGRTLGFPTANLAGVRTLVPPDGVYAGACSVDGEVRPAAVNVGGNPTFGVTQRKVEAHVLDFDGDLYGCDLAVRLVDRIRGTVAFDDVEDLKRQIEADIAVAGRLAVTAQRSCGRRLL